MNNSRTRNKVKVKKKIGKAPSSYQSNYSSLYWILVYIPKYCYSYHSNLSNVCFFPLDHHIQSAASWLLDWSFQALLCHEGDPLCFSVFVVVVFDLCFLNQVSSFLLMASWVNLRFPFFPLSTKLSMIEPLVHLFV